MNKTNCFWKFLVVVIMVITSSGCGDSQSKSDLPKETITFEDIVKSLKKMDLKPTEANSQSYSLNGVEPKTIKLSNGNIIEAFIYSTPEEVSKAHQEFNDKTVTADFKVPPQVFNVKNSLIIYYDYQFSNLLGNL